MTSLWAARDLPVLVYLVDQLDSLDTNRVEPEDVAAATGLDLDAVHRALRTLADAEPPYIEGPRAAEAAYPLFVTGLRERAYRAVGAWPTAEGLAQQLVAAIDSAAETEPDPAEKSRLRALGSWLAGTGGKVALEIGTKFIEHQAGLS